MRVVGRTRVYLTVDVECAEERVRGTTVRPPLGYDLRVWGRLSNQRSDWGLPLLIRELGEAGLSGTFFVEALGARHFGEAGLKEVCRFVRDGGHDVQLHLHPIQRHADWKSRGQPRPSDEMADYCREEQQRMLEDGIHTLERCGVPRSTLLAFRAGDFGASEETWRAMAACGLCVSSNFNLCYRDGPCRIRWPRPENALFDTGTGVWELPISNFAERPNRFRHLQISAVSFPEMRHYLLEAQRLGLPEVTVVTHPFEYFYVDSPRTGAGRPNVFNVERLRRLCAFLRDHDHLFEVETVGRLARRIAQRRIGCRLTSAPVPPLPPTLRYGRWAEQAYKRLSERIATLL